MDTYFYIFCSLLFILNVHCYEHAVFLEQLDGVTCLPGDRDQPDQILFREVEITEGCIPDDKIAIKFSMGEFANRWKAIFLHRSTDMNTYKPLLELKENEKEVIAVVDKARLQNDNVICLWKDIDELIGWGPRNIYYIRNTHELEAGKMYHFFWFKDDAC